MTVLQDKNFYFGMIEHFSRQKSTKLKFCASKIVEITAIGAPKSMNFILTKI